MLKTEERFERRPFKREDVPLTFWTNETEEISVRLEIEEQAFADAQDWLGVENLKKIGEKWFADLTPQAHRRKAG